MKWECSSECKILSDIVMYVRLLTLTSSLQGELGFLKMNKEVGDGTGCCCQKKN